MSFQDVIVPLTEERATRLTERPKLRAGHYRGVIVSQKLKADAEGYPVLSERPKTEGCPEFLLTIKPLSNPDDFGTEVNVPVFHTLPLPISTKRADGSTVEITKEAFELANGMLSTFVEGLQRFNDRTPPDQKKEYLKATEQAAIALATGQTSLVNNAIYFTVEHNGNYVNFKRFRKALNEGETLVAPADMVL